MEGSGRPGPFKTPRSKRQEEYKEKFEQLSKGSPEYKRQRRIERREWKRLHSKEGRKLDKEIVADEEQDKSITPP